LYNKPNKHLLQCEKNDVRGDSATPLGKMGWPATPN
jgi:hypothetical protein